MLDHAIQVAPEVFGDIDVGQRVQGSTRVFLRRDGGEIRPSTASSAAKDGGKETFCVQDEVHHHVTPELHAMDATIRRNLMKRKRAEPWLLRTSTAHRPGQLSVSEEHHDHAKAVLEGRSPLAGLYLNHREGTRPADWGDDDQVLAMLREAYGDAVDWMDLERILADECRNPQADPGDSQRYFGNLLSTTSSQAFDPARWGELAKPGFDLGARPLVVAGFDGARFHDATALVATHVETGHQWPLGIWERPFDVADWEVDEDDVDQTVERAFDELDVWRLYGDPPYWESSFKRWQGRHGEKKVLAWWTNRLRPMAFALRAYAGAQRAGELSHDGDPRFAVHVGNARRHETNVRDDEGRRMWVIRKEHPDSPNKIDAAMAGCLSWEARGDAIAAGAKRKGRRAVFV
jgi:phage terminase large subunit-like protein